MKIVITQEQKKLIKESTNRSAKLLGKFYDIEADGAYYLGDGMIQSRVRFTPKDFDNPMTPQYGESVCNWRIYMPSDLTFAAMTLPDSFNVPLMDHIGNTEELEEYLKGLHREDAEEFVRKINHRRNNPLKESVDRKKKLFIDLLGQDLIDSIRTITSPKQLPKEFSKVIGSNIIQKYIDVYGPLYYFVLDGEPFIYKDRDDYEMFVDSNGKGSVKNEITIKLGLADMGLKFSDVIDIFHNDEEPLNESVDKNKKFLTNVMGQDFTGKIKEVKDLYDVPMSFDDGVSPGLINLCLNHWGPMYLVNINGKNYLYQDRSDDYEVYEWFHDENGFNYVNDEITEQLGISDMGLKFSNIIDTFYKQEGEPLNEENDKPDWLRENTKVKTLLKKMVEGREFEISFEDKWGDLDEHIETYTFHYRMEVGEVLGVGSDTVARVEVIIDDITLDGESVYAGWSEIGYSNSVWYIDKLQDHLYEEVFEVLPFSTYLNFYGHDEEI